MDWSSRRDLAKFSAAGVFAVLVSGVLAEVLLPETGSLVSVKAVIPAAVGSIIGVYMMNRLSESELLDFKAEN